MGAIAALHLIAATWERSADDCAWQYACETPTWPIHF